MDEDKPTLLEAEELGPPPEYSEHPPAYDNSGHTSLAHDGGSAPATLALTYPPPYNMSMLQHSGVTTCHDTGSTPQGTHVTRNIHGNVFVMQQPQLKKPSMLKPMIFSCIVLWMCNPVFGGIGFVFALVGMFDADAGRYDTARKKANLSVILGLVGLGVSLVLGIIIGITFAVHVHKGLPPSLYR